MSQTALPLVLCALLVPLAVPTAEAQVDVERVEAVADSLAQSQLTKAVPGMTVAVARGGEILFERGYGLADVEAGAAAGPETVYRIGSVTKQFTAALVLRLAEAGQVALDDPVTAYLPDYPAQGSRLTLRALLTHTSGIGSERDTSADARDQPRRRTLHDLTDEEMLGLFADAPLAFEPGQQFAYSNQGYIVLGMIIGRVTGVPYTEYVERELLLPLGLTDTRYCDAERILPNRAHGYASRDGELVNAPYVSMRNPGAAGALCSTVGDLVRWTHLLHAGQVVSPASLREMTTPAVLATGETAGYGYGLFLDELGGHRTVFHGGSISGFGAALYHVPEKDLTVAVLMNSASGDRHEVAKSLARAALGVELLDLPLGAEDAARYAGTYAVPTGGGTVLLRVFDEGGRLHANVADDEPLALLHQGDGVFVAALSPGTRLTFSAEGSRADGVTVELRGRVYHGERVL